MKKIPRNITAQLKDLKF